MQGGRSNKVAPRKIFHKVIHSPAGNQTGSPFPVFPLRPSPPIRLSSNSKPNFLLQSNPHGRTIARLFVMGGTNAQLPIGQQVSLPGHFDLPVTLESARPLGKGFECRVRLPDGTLDEAVINQEEAAALAGAAPAPEAKIPLANAGQLRPLIESARIRLPEFLADAEPRTIAPGLSGAGRSCAQRRRTGGHLCRRRAIRPGQAARELERGDGRSTGKGRQPEGTGAVFVEDRQ
jgi:hypothetical protein